MSAHPFPAPTGRAMRDAFIDNQTCRYAASGFMLDEEGYVRLLLSCNRTIDVGAYSQKTEQQTQTLTLYEIQKIAQYFADQIGSDDKIFSAAPEAQARQQTLGYVCYQMTRRLQRLEHDHFPESKKLNYNRAFDETRMAAIIRDVLGGKVDNTGFVSTPEYNTIRAAEIPQAMEHQKENISKLSPYPAGLFLTLV